MKRMYHAVAGVVLFIVILGIVAWFATPGSTVKVIHVPASDAAETARILDEAFNGEGPSRIVVFAIPMTNSLFVKADADDLRCIQALLLPLRIESVE
jgi:hypothetical protein